MAEMTDPFERAVARERTLRDRAEAFESRSAMLGLAMRWYAVLGAGWAVVLSAHWLLFDQPRWLVVLHSVVFTLVVGYSCVAMVFIMQMKRRRPDWFGD